MYGKDTSSVSVALVNTLSSDEPSRRDVVVILFSSSLALEARARVFDEGERNKELKSAFEMKRCKTRERERKRRHFLKRFGYLDALFASRDGIKTKDGVLRKVLV